MKYEMFEIFIFFPDSFPLCLEKKIPDFHKHSYPAK